jgi:hypothetical protein
MCRGGSVSGTVRLLLLTYAGFRLPGRRSNLDEDTSRVNDEMRRFAEQYGHELVDVRERLLGHLGSGAPRSEFFLNEGESDPNPRGYAEIVSQLVADLAFLPTPTTTSLSPRRPSDARRLHRRCDRLSRENTATGPSSSPSPTAPPTT